MNRTYVVEFNITNNQNDWSRKEFTSLFKALSFARTIVKQGGHIQIF